MLVTGLITCASFCCQTQKMNTKIKTKVFISISYNQFVYIIIASIFKINLQTAKVRKTGLAKDQNNPHN